MQAGRSPILLPCQEHAASFAKQFVQWRPWERHRRTDTDLEGGGARRESHTRDADSPAGEVQPVSPRIMKLFQKPILSAFLMSHSPQRLPASVEWSVKKQSRRSREASYRSATSSSTRRLIRPASLATSHSPESLCTIIITQFPESQL